MDGEFTEARDSSGNVLDQRFVKEKRTQACAELMRPEVRKLLDLPLHQKIRKTQEIIKEAIEKYSRVGIGFSGGTDSLVLLHIALPVISHDFPIIFVNTQHQFPETYDFINKIVKEWKLKNYHEVRSKTDNFEIMKEKYGLKTPEFTELCCAYHKIAPLKNAIDSLNLNAFISGIRGVEHEERAKESIFSPREGHFRVHPLLFWTSQEILDYVKMFEIECNPLYAEGYTSLGCIPCTEKNPDPMAHERAGRGIVRENIMERLRDLGYT
jgi:phosphoadenosine phosphosulfate reductase